MMSTTTKPIRTANNRKSFAALAFAFATLLLPAVFADCSSDEPAPPPPVSPEQVDSGAHGDLGLPSPDAGASPDIGATDTPLEALAVEPDAAADSETRPDVAADMVRALEDAHLAGIDAITEADVVSLPQVSSWSPDMIFPGDTVVLRGMSLKPNPRVFLDGKPIAIVDATETQVRFAVPADLAISGCISTIAVVLETDAGSTLPLAMQIHRRPPQFAVGVTPAVNAGAVVSLKGVGLADVEVTLATKAVAATSTEGQIFVTIPRDFPQGLATVVAKGTCGQDQTNLLVLAPVPRIVALDPATVAPEGVLLVTADFSDRSNISSVTIGSDTVTTFDPANFAWAPAQSSTQKNVFAVRVPAGATPGSVQMTLTGSLGTSEPAVVNVIALTQAHPPSSKQVLFAPEAAGDDDTFPLGTRDPYGAGDIGPQTPDDTEWGYEVSFYDDGSKNIPRTCTNIGTVTGREHHCIASPCTPLRLGCTNQVCSPLHGTYQLGKLANKMDLFVDRTASGGAVEEYVGGWAQGDTLLPPSAAVSSGATMFHSAYLLLRSRTTGIEFVILHGVSNNGLMEVACNPAP